MPHQAPPSCSLHTLLGQIEVDMTFYCSRVTAGLGADVFYMTYPLFPHLNE